MNVTGNFSNYRKELAGAKLPAVPALPVVLSDLVFLNEEQGNPSLIPPPTEPPKDLASSTRPPSQPTPTSTTQSNTQSNEKEESPAIELTKKKGGKKMKEGGTYKLYAHMGKGAQKLLSSEKIRTRPPLAQNVFADDNNNNHAEQTAKAKAKTPEFQLVNYVKRRIMARILNDNLLVYQRSRYMRLYMLLALNCYHDQVSPGACGHDTTASAGYSRYTRDRSISGIVYKHCTQPLS